MVRMRRFDSDLNVRDAAVERMEHVFDMFDDVVVSCSGGKDSLATLWVTKEAADRVGRTKPIPVVFRELEYMHSGLQAIISDIARLDWVDLHWWRLRATGSVTLIDQKFDFEHWAPERADRWRAPEPPDHVNVWYGDLDHAYTPEERDDAIAALRPGLIALTTGVRAAESILRYRACVNKLHEPYVTSCRSKKAKMVKPIYDWAENDVFKYLHEMDIAWAPAYNDRLWAGQGEMRTGSAVAVEEIKTLDVLRQSDPPLYAALLADFPDIGTADRYYRDFNRYAGEMDVFTLDQVEAFALQRFANEPAALERAMDKVNTAKVLARNNPGGFPAWYVYREVIADRHGNGIRPLAKGTKPPKHLRDRTAPNAEEG